MAHPLPDAVLACWHVDVEWAVAPECVAQFSDHGGFAARDMLSVVVARILTDRDGRAQSRFGLCVRAPQTVLAARTHVSPNLAGSRLAESRSRRTRDRGSA